MNDEKFECLKYFGKTYEHKRGSSMIKKEFPSLDQVKMFEYLESWRISQVF